MTKIKELFSDSSKWTQGEYAKDAKGNMVWVDSPKAVCWCLEGAVRHCYPPSKWCETYAKLHNELGGWASVWNDNNKRTFEEVKALVEKLDV